MGVEVSSEELVTIYQTTRRHAPEHCNLHMRRSFAFHL
jgi:hypothetical protein